MLVQVDRMLVLVELVEREGQSTLSGTGVVPVVQERLETTGPEGDVLRGVR